jgi:hypothetical protein
MIKKWLRRIEGAIQLFENRTKSSEEKESKIGKCQVGSFYCLLITTLAK